MELYIDPRAGSNKLLERFPNESQEMMLEAGDIAFFGNGPADKPWWIGIEYKTLEDVVGCIKSGRFTGTQLPAMMRIYDLCFLLVEGIPVPDRHSGQLVKYRGKFVASLGLPYSAFDNFLTSVSVFSALAGKPCIVKMAGTEQQTLHIIRDTWSLFQKPWDAHRAMSNPDQTKFQRVSYDMELLKSEPGDDGYPQYLLRKALFQIRGIGWETAGQLADRFGTMENLLVVGYRDLMMEGVGKGLAQRIYLALHGYPDMSVVPRKSRKHVPKEIAISDIPD